MNKICERVSLNQAIEKIEFNSNPLDGNLNTAALEQIQAF